jgi:hypothetical protein
LQYFDLRVIIDYLFTSKEAVSNSLRSLQITTC